MKKAVSLLLAITILFSSLAGLNIVSSATDLPSSGSCGKNATYTFDSSMGELVISGNGHMRGYGMTDSPFYNQNAIKTVIINSGVTSIGNWAFNECYGLISISIPDSVTSIDQGAFGYCSSLTSIAVDSGNRVYDSRDNCNAIIKTATNTLITGCQNTVISDSVTSIGGYAFFGCSGLTSITIPDSVTSISNYAFSGCTGLKELTMPCSAKIYNSEYTFKNCSNIEKVTLTKGTGNMQNYYPYDNASDTYYRYTPWYISRNNLKDLVLEDGITNIGNYAFYNCTNLTSISIPNSVKSIGSYAFKGCNGLTIYGQWGSKAHNYAVTNGVAFVGPEHEHQYSSQIIEPTCTKAGEKRFTCSVCGDYYTESIPMIAHNYTSSGTRQPTCVKEGEKRFTCSVCGDYYTESIPIIAHNYTSSVSRQPTCVKEGEKLFTCSVCGDYYTESIPVIAHNYTSSVTRQPSCVKEGEKLFTCSMCGNTYTENIPLISHNYIGENTITKATPGQNGKVLKTKCSVCGTQGETEVIYSPKDIMLSDNTFTYSGKACKPTVTLKDSAGQVIDASHYKVAYSNNVNAGTAKVTLTFIGDYYEGSMSKSFKIAPKKLTSCKVDSAFTYTGKAIVPVPYYNKTVTNTDYNGEPYSYAVKTNYKKGKDYTISVSGEHKNVGKYTATIKFKGNYTGTVKKTFEIRPKPVTKSKAVPYSTTSIKVSWGKVSSVSGYSVYRYNNQKNKWVKYKNTTATSMVVPRISAKDTYIDVRIWSYKKVGGKVYYNVSSRVHFESEHTKPNKPSIKLANTDFGDFIIKINREAWHQTQVSDNKAFSNKGNNICVTYRNYNSKVTATGWGSVKKYYVRSREYFYDNNGKLIVGPWSDVKSIETY